MKITRIEAIPFSIPYRKPLRFASGPGRGTQNITTSFPKNFGRSGQASHASRLRVSLAPQPWQASARLS